MTERPAGLQENPHVPMQGIRQTDLKTRVGETAKKGCVFTAPFSQPTFCCSLFVQQSENKFLKKRKVPAVSTFARFFRLHRLP